MKQFLLLIAPVHADPDFARKMTIVRDLCSTRGLHFRIPQVNPAPFNLRAELAFIQDAQHIIADLSYGRPSCYYELGLVEASQKQAVLIAATGTDVFQHAGHAPVAYFDDLKSYVALVGRVLDG